MADHRETFYKPFDHKFFPDNDQTEGKSPDDKVQCASVPESGQKPDDHQISYRDKGSAAAPAKGNINIIAEPASQCRVPPPVKISDAVRCVGVGKVLYKAEAQHQSDASRHQGISPEVKIELHGITYSAHPCKRSGNALKPDLDDLVPKNPQSVSDQDLHSQSHGKKDETVLHFLQGDRALDELTSAPDISGPLHPPLTEPHDGALCDLGKHGKVSSCLQKTGPLLNLAVVHVSLIRHHLKNKKAEAQGEDRRIQKESKCLEEHQDENIKSDDHKKQPLVPGPVRQSRHDPERVTEGKIDEDQGNKEQDKKAGTGRVKHETSRKEDSVPKAGRSQTIYK